MLWFQKIEGLTIVYALIYALLVDWSLVVNINIWFSLMIRLTI